MFFKDYVAQCIFSLSRYNLRGSFDYSGVDLYMKKNSKSRLPKYLRWVPKALYFVGVALLISFLFKWTTPGSQDPSDAVGFGTGLLHGAMMPAAMPSLFMGIDVPIYAENNVGIPYKLGYTLGVNACGALFFGILFFQFLKIKKKRSATKVIAQENQEKQVKEEAPENISTKSDGEEAASSASEDSKKISGSAEKD